MIIVTGTVLLHADTIDEAARLSTEHVARSRAEPGCITHDVLLDSEDALRLHFLERWDDMPALWAHFALPASRAFVDALVRLSAERPTMALYEATEIDELGQKR